MSDFTMELMDVEGVIENEIRQGCGQKHVAMTYAMGITVRHYKVDWPRVNKAIVDKWPKGLQRVKTMAWKLVEEKQKEALQRIAESN